MLKETGGGEAQRKRRGQSGQAQEGNEGQTNDLFQIRPKGLVKMEKVHPSQKPQLSIPFRAGSAALYLMEQAQCFISLKLNSAELYSSLFYLSVHPVKQVTVLYSELLGKIMLRNTN